MLKISNCTVSATPFLCGVCCLGFADEDSLKDHVISHENDFNQNSINILADNTHVTNNNGQKTTNDVTDDASKHKMCFTNYKDNINESKNAEDNEKTSILQKHDKPVENKDSIQDFINKSLDVFKGNNNISLIKNKAHKIIQNVKAGYNESINQKVFLRKSCDIHPISDSSKNNTPVLHCPECTQTFKSKESLHTHMERKHTIVHPYICHECGDSFAHKSDLAHHKMIHTDVRPFNHGTIFKAFPSNSKPHHLQKRAEIKTHICPHCDKGFCHRSSLRNHLKSHDPLWKDKHFSCNECGKKFLTNNMLKEHNKIHLGIRPVQCKFCDQRFRSKSCLLRHEHTHYKDNTIEIQNQQQKPFQCDECGQKFWVKYDLQRHTAAVHLNEKPFKCSLCDKAFIHKGALNRHTRTHTGEKPYSCNLCGKTFGDSSGLRCHKRVHSGFKPYKCETCGETYSQSTSLKNHRERLHH